MLAWLARLNPFKTPDAKRLAVLFAVVYFAQGMWYLPNQTITIVLKDRGLSAGQVADFGLITIIPWFIKPLYGLLSDFVPLFGRRRQSYFLLTSALAGVAGLALAWGDWIAHGEIWTFDLFGLTTFTLVEGVVLFTVMALGLAFTDVLTDAMMVENGRPRGLTGAFQSVQWAAITLASINSTDPLHPTLHPVPYVGVQYVDIPQFESLGVQVAQQIAGAIAGTESVSQALKTSQADASQYTPQELSGG